MAVISVIIPNYNTEKYIGETIQSVLDQSFSDFELIIVDDGSTDHSIQIIREYSEKDERIQLVENSHKGLSLTRLDGLKNASGEWICYLDSDDLIHSRTLEILLQYAQSKDADLVQIRHRDFSPAAYPDLFSGKDQSPFTEICTGKESLLFFRGHTPCYDITAGPWGKLYHRTLFQNPEICQWLEEGATEYPYNFFNDFSLIPRLQFFSKKVILIDQFMYFHRVHPGNISATPHIGPTHYERISVVESNIRFFDEHGFPDAVSINITNYFLFILSYWYKGWITDRESELFKYYQKQIEVFYKKYLVRLDHIPKKEWSSPLEQAVIRLWPISPGFWAFVVGNLYFEKRYKYNSILQPISTPPQHSAKPSQ